MNAQHSTHLGRCLFGDISIIVHCNFAFKSSITTIGSNWTIWWVLASIGEFEAIAYAITIPNGRTSTCVSTTTT